MSYEVLRTKFSIKITFVEYFSDIKATDKEWLEKLHYILVRTNLPLKVDSDCH